MTHTIAVIMAAGEGTRMKSELPKVLHKICGKTMVEYVIRAMEEVCTQSPILVIGHGAADVQEYFKDRVRYAFQGQPLGTGHAVMIAKDALVGKEGYVLITAGDMPLVTGDTVKRLIQFTKDNEYAAVALTANMQDPTGYGRIIRNHEGTIQRIVEHKDASDEEKMIREINASLYCFSIVSLLSTLERINNTNTQGEYYLTDALGILVSDGCKVGALQIEDATEIMGINNRVQLAEATWLMRKRINERHMMNGVTILDPASTYIDQDVIIERDTMIYPGNVLENATCIGQNCILYPNNRVVDSRIEQGVSLQSSVIISSDIGEYTTVGPYAYIRPGSKIDRNVRIGDFVEIKNSTIGERSKVSHLTYVGDGSIGKDCNIGCGVVFVNYDGAKKHKTTVGDHVFVGCNVNLVAPVEIEDGAYIAAGSTVTAKVPRNALCIARARQVNKPDWVIKRKIQKEE